MFLGRVPPGEEPGGVGSGALGAGTDGQFMELIVDVLSTVEDPLDVLLCRLFKEAAEPSEGALKARLTERNLGILSFIDDVIDDTVLYELSGRELGLLCCDGRKGASFGEGTPEMESTAEVVPAVDTELRYMVQLEE